MPNFVDEQLQLFANIFLDGEIGGSPLQGTTFPAVVGNLLSFLNVTKQNPDQHFPYKSSELAKIQENLQQINNHALSKDIDKIAKDVLTELNEKGDVFFPGGWSAHPFGHAIIYRLFKDKNNHLIFLAYNTGAGSEYHKKIANAEFKDPFQYKEKFNPVYAIRFQDSEQLKQYGGLNSWIKKLIEPTVLPDSDPKYEYNNAEAIYTNIFALSHYLGGEIVDPELYYPFITQGQLSGTCAQQSVQKMLQSFFENPTDFDRFLLDYRVYVLDDYISNKKMPLQFKKEFYAAFENTARMINTGKDLEKVLQEQEIAILISKLNQIKKRADIFFNQQYNTVNTKEIKQEVNNKVKPIPSQEIAFPPFSRAIQYRFEKKLEEVKEDQGALSKTVAFVFGKLTWPFAKKRKRELSEQSNHEAKRSNETALLFKKTATFTEAVKLLKEESFKPNKRNFIHNLEQLNLLFCDQLKNFKQQPFNQTISIEEWMETVNLLTHYSSIYFEYFFSKKSANDDAYDSDADDESSHKNKRKACASPRNQIFGLALMNLSHYAMMGLNAKILGYSTWQKELVHLDDYLAYLPSFLLFNKMKKDVFLSSTDPELSTLLNNIKQYYQGARPMFHERDMGLKLAEHYKHLLHSKYCLNENNRLEQFFKDNLKFFYSSDKVECSLSTAFKKILDKEGLSALYVKHCEKNELRGIAYPEVENIKKLLQIQENSDACLRHCVLNIINPNKASDYHHKKFAVGSYGEEIYLQTTLTQGSFGELSLISEFQSEEKSHDKGVWNSAVINQLTHVEEYCQSKQALSQAIKIPLKNDANNLPIDSNAIHHLNEMSLNDKELWHLRTAPSLQAIEIIDYFTRHIDLLEHQDYQLYMLLSLFQPGVLDSALALKADILSGISLLSQKATLVGDLDPNSSSLTARGLFIMQLSSYIYGYILSSQNTPPEMKQAAAAQYQHWEKMLQHWILCSHQEPMQTELQRLSFYTLMKCYTPQQLQSSEFAPVLDRLLYARFYLEQHAKEKALGTHYQAVDESYESLFFKIAEIGKEALAPALARVLNKLIPEQGPYTLIPQQGSEIDFCYLDKKKKQRQMNVLDGSIILENQNYVILPPHLTESETFIKVFGKDAKPLALKKNINGHNEYEFYWQNEKYYFIDKELFKKVGNQYYQYHADNFLPQYLQNKENYIWVNSKGTHAQIISKAVHEKIVYEWKEGTIYSYDPEGIVCLNGPERDKVLNLFSSFEDPSFIRIIQLKPLESQHYEFYLPRYQLKGTWCKGVATFELNDKKYRITQEASPLKTGLIIAEFPKCTDRLLLVPRQAFYTERTIVDNRYELVHDIHKKLNENPVWNVEKYITYRFDDFGQLMPAQSEAKDLLYLVYLYCAHHEWDKAYALLNQYSFENTAEELKFMHWLCEKLPAALPNQENLDDLSLTNSKLLAIQLKTLSKLSLLSPELIEKTDRNTQDFLQNLPEKIIKIYNRYHLIANNLSEEKKIPQEIIESLANEVWLALEKKKNSALEQIKILDKKLIGLTEQAAKSISAEKEEWTQIIKKCEEHQSSGYLAAVYARTACFSSQSKHMQKGNFRASITNFTDCQVKPVEPNYFSIAKSFSDKYSNNIYLDEIENSPEKSTFYKNACDKLTLDLSLTDLEDNLKYFVPLIFDEDKANDRYRVRLKDFCQKTVIAYDSSHDKANLERAQKLEIISFLLGNVSLHSYDYKRIKASGEKFSLSDVCSKFQTSYFSQPLKKINISHSYIPVIFDKPKVSDAKICSDSVQNSKDRLALESPVEGRRHLDSMPAAFGSIAFELLRHYEINELQKNKLIQEYKALNANHESGNYSETDKKLDLVTKEYRGNIVRLMASLSIPEGKKSLNSALNYLSESILDSKEQVQHYASYLPANLKDLLTLETKQLSAKQSALSIDALLLQYGLGIDKAFLKKRLVPNQAIPLVQKELQNFLRQVFLYRQYQRLLDTLNRLTKEREFSNREELLFLLAKQLMELHPQKNLNAIHLFQYRTEKTIRQEQLNFINRFLSDSNQVGQMIMGGGKTKVILPILAFLKANGKQLAVIMVPQELLQTNYLDLKRTLKDTFDQDLELFHFDRKTPVDAISLLSYLKLFKECIAQKKCLIMDANSLKSLHLKWRDLLYQAQSVPVTSEVEYKKICEQIDLLKEMLLIFKVVNSKGSKENGSSYIIADEAHKIFDINVDLNYSLGKKEPLEEAIIKSTLDLYEFMDQKVILVDKNHPLAPLNGLFLTNLLQHPDLLQQPPELIKHLINYYAQSYERSIYPDVSLSPRVKQLLSNQWNLFLPKTLLDKLYEDYGPSPKAAISFAVPYNGNQVPTTNLFYHPIKTLNCTIQMTYVEGIVFSEFKKLLQAWKKADQMFLSKNNHELSPAALSYRECLLSSSASGKMPQKLQDVDFNNEETLIALHSYLRKNKIFIRAALEEIILPTIETFPHKLTSNAITLASMGDCLQGFAGTLESHPTFHRLPFDEASSFGTKNYLKQLLIDKKTIIRTNGEEKSGTPAIPVVCASVANTKSHTLDSRKPFMPLEEKPHEFRESINLANMSALIDVGDHQRGQSNLQVAKNLAEQLRNTDKKYVLFFNHDQLCALKIGTTELITLPSSEASIIKEHLKVEPKQCFTYYDQNHSTGIDITQDDKAVALVTVDITTTLSKFLQAIMRMRKLAADQQIEILVTPALKARLGSHCTLPALYEHFEQTEKTAIADDVSEAACKKIKNVVQEDLDKRLLKVSSEESIRLFQSFQLLLVDKAPDILTEFKDEHEPMPQFLENYKNNLLTIWKELTGKNSFKRLQDLCDVIMKHALTYCNGIGQKSLDLNTQVNIEQDEEQDVAMKLKLDTKLNTEAEIIKSLIVDPNWALDNGLFRGANVNYAELNSLWNKNNQNIPTNWSNNLLVSSQFYLSHTKQSPDTFPNESCKPPLATLFWRSNHVLHSLLLNQEEADIFGARLARGDQFNEPSAQIWLETTTGLTIAGTKPPLVDNDREYIALKEQIYTLEAEVPLLLAKNKWLWFSEKHIDLLKSQLVKQGKMAYMSLIKVLDNKLHANTKDHAPSSVSKFPFFQPPVNPSEPVSKLPQSSLKPIGAAYEKTFEMKNKGTGWCCSF